MATTLPGKVWWAERDRRRAVHLMIIAAGDCVPVCNLNSPSRRTRKVGFCLGDVTCRRCLKVMAKKEEVSLAAAADGE